MRVGYLFHILFQNHVVFHQSSASPVLQGRELLNFLSFVLELCDPDSTAPPLCIPKHLRNCTKLGWWDFIAVLSQQKWWNRSLVSSTHYLHWILSETDCFIKIGRHVKRTLEDSFHCTLQYTELCFFWIYNEMKYYIYYDVIPFFLLLKNPPVVGSLSKADISNIWEHRVTPHRCWATISLRLKGKAFVHCVQKLGPQPTFSHLKLGTAIATEYHKQVPNMPATALHFLDMK